jgi:hypothetical protein
MILVRQVFQVKFGQMDKVLSYLDSVSEDLKNSTNFSRILTDISGNNFTLVIETKAESMDAWWEGLQAMFKNQEASGQTDGMSQYIESGYKEFYNIEYENGG